MCFVEIDREGQVKKVVDGGNLLSLDEVQDLIANLSRYGEKQYEQNLKELERFYTKRGKAMRREKGQKQVSVYLAYDKGNQVYKIGHSQDLTTRLRKLRGANPFIDIIWSKRGTLAHERFLRSHFSQKQVEGEFFKLSQEDVDWIKEAGYWENVGKG